MIRPSNSRTRVPWIAQAAIVVALVCLAIANIAQRASWSEVEDGVLWRATSGDVVAQEIASGSAAAKAGVQPGDVLLAIDGRPVGAVEDVVASHHASREGQAVEYTLLRMKTREQVSLAGQPIPSSPRALYYMLALVGVFSLLVGASVRLRRPDHQATLQFFWLTVAFFGMLAFSFTGRLTPLAWPFYRATSRHSCCCPRY